MIYPLKMWVNQFFMTYPKNMCKLVFITYFIWPIRRPWLLYLIVLACFQPIRGHRFFLYIVFGPKKVSKQVFSWHTLKMWINWFLWCISFNQSGGLNFFIWSSWLASSQLEAIVFFVYIVFGSQPKPVHGDGDTTFGSHHLM